MSKFSVVAFFVAASVTSAFAQAPSGDTCVKLADTIAAGYSTSFSDNKFAALRYYANCEATQSASGGGLNIGYAAFSLGAKYDEAARRDFCSKSYDSYDIKSTDYNSVKIVFNQALATINKCLELAAKGWDIKYEQIAPDTVSLAISNGSALGGKLYGVDIIPPGALQCVPAIPSHTIIVTATTSISMTCSRTPLTREADGIQLISAADVVLNLRLAEGPFPIRMPGYSSSVLQRIDQKIDAARAELMSKLPNAADFSVVPSPSKPQHVEFGCPPGTVLISAACTNDNGTQTAVGPTFLPDGTVQCQRYSTATRAEGSAICMKLKK